MVFNQQAFKIRALTSIVFVVIMLAGLLWNQWSFIILFTIIHFGCWFEFIQLIKKIYPTKFGYYLPLGLIYITLPFWLMIDLWIIPIHIEDPFMVKVLTGFLPIIIIISIWINDTMAYIVGSFIGKTQLSKISPKKTWEGTIGGAVLCITVIALIVWWAKLYPVKHFVIIAASCAFFGTLGDLFQSKLKRLAGVKDSGNILPGHGGFLDRFDSLLFSTPFVWIYVYFFMQQ